jgi:hypothetical protein
MTIEWLAPLPCIWEVQFKISALRPPILTEVLRNFSSDPQGMFSGKEKIKMSLCLIN